MSSRCGSSDLMLAERSPFWSDKGLSTLCINTDMKVLCEERGGPAK